jgi:hypothetical protein
VEDQLRQEVIASAVVAEFAPDRSRILRRIMSGDKSLPARRDQQRRQNSQNRRFSRAICAQQCDCFAFLHFEGDALECYSGARRRIIFLQILQDNSGERRGILHRIFIASRALQYKPYPGVRIWRR